jgi:hypothetical protein
MKASINQGLIRFAIVFVSALLCLPILYISLHGGLDVSWMYGLHKANIEGLIFGKNIVFTYGPLGYLMYPVFVTKSLY